MQDEVFRPKNNWELMTAAEAGTTCEVSSKFLGSVMESLEHINIKAEIEGTERGTILVKPLK